MKTTIIGKALLATLLLTATLQTTAQDDYLHPGFTVTLREDLGKINPVHNENIYPSTGEFNHVFGTELSVGYRLVAGRRWTFGLSAGLALHDYSHTHSFDGVPQNTQTNNQGDVFTHRTTYHGRTTLNLPVLMDAKLHFVDFAEQTGWDVVPLLSARLGYVVGLTSIKGEEHHAYHFPSATPPNDRTDHTDYTFNKQGIYYSIGIGASFRQFEIELEYAMQPNTLIGKQTETYKPLSTNEMQVIVHEAERYTFAGGDGFTLRLTYNF